MTLGEHLGTDENACFAGSDARENRLHLAFAAHAVAIEPHQRHARELITQQIFHALRPLADWLDLVSATWAAERHRLIGAAVMAAQPL